jgi:hypothetical protein
MKYRVKRQLSTGAYGIIGDGSGMNAGTERIVMKWEDKNGRMTRPGGEMDGSEFDELIALAIEESFRTPQQVVAALLKGMKAYGQP